MKTLIIKLGASGDVVRSTPLLEIINGEIFWLVSSKNKVLLDHNPKITALITLENIKTIFGTSFDLVINLEESVEVARLLKNIHYKKIIGVNETEEGHLAYSDSSSEWFNMSLISQYSREKANRLKLANRKSYQEIFFNMFGYSFSGENYYLPPAVDTNLTGDIAIAPHSGNRWPMKNWAFYKELKLYLENRGFKVNFLPLRNNLLEHIGDIQNHQFIICGDSLPMHVALGSGINCMAFFICTSPWEIFSYGLLKKLISPEIEKYFYKCGIVENATKSISFEKAINEIELSII